MASRYARFLAEPRVIAGLLGIVVGVLLVASYEPAEYATESSLTAASTEEYVRIERANEAKERARDEHRIAIGVCLGLGALMVFSGGWRVRRRIEESPLEELAGAVKVERLLEALDDALDD